MFSIKRVLSDIDSVEYIENKYEDYCSNIEDDRFKLSYEEWYESYGNRWKISGRVHGMIIDVNFYCHIRINPRYGEVIFYKSELYEVAYLSFEELLIDCYKDGKKLYDIIVCKSRMYKDVNKILTSSSCQLDDKFILRENAISYNRRHTNMVNAWHRSLYALQSIYEVGLVQLWNDELLMDT